MSGGTSGPRTTCPGGHLVLGSRVRGDIWSGGTTCPLTPTLERAKEALRKGPKFISDRQKLIKIADRLELGWGGSARVHRGRACRRFGR